MTIEKSIRYLPPCVMILAAIHSLITNTLSSLVVFIVSSILFGIFEALSKREKDQIESIQAEIKQLKDRMDAVIIGRSMGL